MWDQKIHNVTPTRQVKEVAFFEHCLVRVIECMKLIVKKK